MTSGNDTANLLSDAAAKAGASRTGRRRLHRTAAAGARNRTRYASLSGTWRRTAFPTQLEQLQQLTAKRLTGYPLQYLLQSWEFYGLELSVGEGVLIPRQDTETIVDFALSCRNGQPTTRLLDLCSGSGCIPLAIAAHLPGVTATAVEYAPDALHYLTKTSSAILPIPSNRYKAMRWIRRWLLRRNRLI